MITSITAYCTRCDWSDEVTDNPKLYHDRHCPDCSGEVITTDESLAVLQMIQNFETVFKLIAEQVPELVGRRVTIHTNRLGLGGNLVAEITG